MKNHECCPMCGSKEVETTCAGYIVKNENRAKCSCGWIGIVDDMVKEKSLFDEIMARKEAKEKEKEVEVRLNADPNKPSTWSEEMIADYFIWIMKKKGERFVEPIIEMLLDKLK